MLAPAGALPDQLYLRLALAHHHALDQRRQRGDLRLHHLAQRRPLVAEDARIAVVVGPERPVDAHLREHIAEDPDRVLDTRVLRVRLDPLECGLGPHALDLELGHEDGELARRAHRDADRPLGGEEVEAREVLDVAVVEEHAAGEAHALEEVEQPRTPRLELGGGDAGQELHCREE